MLLNEVLAAELTAVNQYFVHAKMCGNRGFAKLADHVRDESIDEMRHAEALVERILYSWSSAVERLNRGIAVATAAADNGTRHPLEEILVSEEEHIDWLETQLEAIRLVGEQQYLAEQLG